MPNEADTCRQYVLPKLQAAGWEDEPHRINEQVTFTDGRIIVAGRRTRRRPGKRADYILRYRLTLGNRRRLPDSLPRPSDRDHSGRRRLAAELW